MTNTETGVTGVPASSLTETQLGAVGENLVANQLVMASAGRLSPFKPVADDGGIDLLIYDKVTGRSLPLQVKSRTRALNSNPKIVHFQVRKATFTAHEHGHLLFVYWSREPLEVQRAWLIPTSAFANVAKETAKDFRIRPSSDTDSQDRFTPFRCTDLSIVTERVITYLEGLPAFC